MKIYFSVERIDNVFLRGCTAAADGDLDQLMLSKRALMRAWTSANSALIDVEDLDLLYNRLKYLTKLQNRTMAEMYDNARLAQ